MAALACCSLPLETTSVSVSADIIFEPVEVMAIREAIEDATAQPEIEEPLPLHIPLVTASLQAMKATNAEQLDYWSHCAQEVSSAVASSSAL